MSRVGRDYLGSFRLVRLLRAGQSCQVWEAIDEEEGGRFALKVLQEKYLGNREEVGYLKHEYEVGGELDHARVIRTYSFNIERNVPYLTLEFFDGRNLKQALRDENEWIMYFMPQIVQQAAEGLEHLHQQGWVHRDVKPDNFMVGDEANVKLIDFAISEKQKRGLGRFLGGRSKVQGTRSYMAPEQIRGAAIDVRTDLYSFGCMLHELIGGKPPFTAGSPDELLGKHLTSPVPSLLAANNTITTDLADLVAMMLAKKRDDRPDSMTEFLRRLRALRFFRTRPKRPKVIANQQDSAEGT